MKAIEAGIQEVGFINAWCDGSGYTIKEDLNIGIAVDLGEKLLVPVVKDVRSKSVLELTVELEELIGKTREEKLEPADVEGGTITLTNVGMFATSYATSVIVQPQVAIVYMGAAVDAPAVVDAVIEIRKKMTFGATFDHRVVNGAAGGRFLKRIKECLEDMGELALRLR
jgi:pyruvate/2-oxoglutarate dehydrogenase complex dihydrolipoamide acyltransferase (E2) component